MMSPYLETLTKLKYNISHSAATASSFHPNGGSTPEQPNYKYHENESSSNSSDNRIILLQNFTTSALDDVEILAEAAGSGNSTGFMSGSHNLAAVSPNQSSTWNETLFRSGEPLLTPPENLTQSETPSDSTVVLCAILIPLLIAFCAILIVALLIRRMRRAESIREIARLKEENSMGQRRHSVVVNPKQSFRLPVVLGLEPLDPAVLNAVPSNNDNGAIGWINPAQNGTTKSPGNTTKTSSTGIEEEPVGLGTRILEALNFPKRLRQKKAERNRFNIYSVSLETREQLKQIYVY